MAGPCRSSQPSCKDRSISSSVFHSAHTVHALDTKGHAKVHMRRSNSCALAVPLREPSIQAHIEEWLRLETDPQERAATQASVQGKDDASLRDMFGRRLEFGTAGLRAKMEPGFNRMNSITVQLASQGLCRYLQEQCPGQLMSGGVVIGYDGRHRSRQFALIAAAVFAHEQIPVQLFSQMVPTPLVAAGTWYLQAAAGIMITASHNPREYNGYKVYWGNGCQIIPPHDEGIARCIAAHGELWPLPPLEDLQLNDPMEKVLREYLHRQQAYCMHKEANNNPGVSPIVYTPLHGVGKDLLLQTFQVFHHVPPVLVGPQQDPDPTFPTVVFPNPEEGMDAWTLAWRTANEQRPPARLCLANDPDADRLAVSERDEEQSEGWRMFSGNEVGLLLADWLWTNFKIKHPEVSPDQVVVLASAVSSKALQSMALREGFRFEETLTGFKWLGNVAQQLESAGYHVLMAFEEAIGYMFYGVVKDKDGITAAAVLTEMAQVLYQRGESLSSHLHDLYLRYGFHEVRAGYYITTPERSRRVFDHLRSLPPTELAGQRVTSIRDLGTGLDTGEESGKSVLPWRPGDMMITYRLANSGSLTLRASGTEPKLKYYLEVVAKEEHVAHKAASTLEHYLLEELINPDKFGLKLPKQGTC